MKLLKSAVKIITVLIVMTMILIGTKVYHMLKAATAYSAKMVSSGVFIEGLEQSRVEQMELTAFPFNYVVNKVDKENKTVESSIFGLISQRAVFKNKIGSTLFQNGKTSLEGRIPVDAIANDTLAWPMGNKLSDSIPAGIDITGLNTFINDYFNAESKAVLVVKEGQIITEKYADGITFETPLLGWSMTKTLTAALCGILVKEGKLSLDQLAPIENWKDDERQKITINNLLQMSSGLEWNEDYSKTSLSDVSEMLYLKGDMSTYATLPNAITEPDSEWKYSSGTTNILSGIIRTCFNDYESYYQFPQKALFNKLGMSHSLMETDATGNFVGSSYGYCSARDWARFGLLYLNNGNWLGEQILPEWWVKYSTTPAKSSDGQYGAQIWLNASKQHMPDMPQDVYFFNGYRGQRVTIIPSKNVVVVCLNSSPEDIDYNTYLSKMMSFIE